jgi:predicted site-specific integrase-resolvase
MNGRWVSTGEACEFYGVAGNTVRRWADNGTIVSKRTPRGPRRYFISEKGILSTEQNTSNRKNYIYVRVSSNKQREDMDRQEAFLRDKYPDHEVVKDIGSGLNYKRKGLLRLLRMSNKNEVGEIVVFSEDRLCRFGFELLEFQFSENNAKLVVHEQLDKSPEEEFTEDILAILQVFACRWNGKRKYKINKNTEVQIETKQYPEEDTSDTQKQL